MNYRIKKIYSSFLNNPVAFDMRKRVKNNKNKNAFRRLESQRKKLIESSKDIDINETNFVFKSIQYEAKDEVVFNIVGSADMCDFSDEGYYIDSLSDTLKINNPDFNIAMLTYANTDFDIETAEKNSGIFFVSETRNLLVRAGERTIAFIGLKSFNKAENSENWKNSTFKAMAFAVSRGTDYIVLCAIRDKESKSKFSQQEKKNLKNFASMFGDLIVGFSENGIYDSKRLILPNHETINTFASIGRLDGKHLEYEGAAVAIETRLKFVEGYKKPICSQSYIPIINCIREGKPFIKLIDKNQLDFAHDIDARKALIYIEKSMINHKDFRENLTIGKICEIIGVPLPDEYAYLNDVRGNNICSRSYEVRRDDVYFFMEPFADKNDEKVLTVEERMPILNRAIRRGARLIFSFTPLDKIDAPCIVIPNAREGHIKVCSYIRSFYDLKSIGITGSIGKTSTKEMLFNVLSQKYNTERNPRNSNVQVNIGQLIQDYKSDCEIYIHEIGGGRPGGASRHSRMILPHIAIVTNIGEAHIGNFGSKEKLMENKLGIIDGMDKDGILVLNADDPLLYKERVNLKTLTYGIKNRNADYFAENIKEEDGRTYFDIMHEGNRSHMMLNVLGEYNVLNAVCCYAVADVFDLSDEEIAAGFLQFETSGVRQNLVEVGGYKLFMDCFNASPSSIDSALSVLDKIRIEPGGKRVALIADVTGAAELKNDLHESIGKIVIKHNIDKLICYGEESKIVYRIAKEAGMEAISITNPKELEYHIMKSFRRQDIMLVKGSSKMRLSERIDRVFGLASTDQMYIDSRQYSALYFNKVKYNLYKQYASAVDSLNYRGTLYVASKVKNRPVLSINDETFAEKRNIEEVVIKKGVLHIGNHAFFECEKIRKIHFPSSIKFIGDGAFENCRLLENVNIGNNVIHIGKEAFKGCESLTKIKLPNSVAYIGEDAFSNCDELNIVCKKDSYAAKYCKMHDIECTLYM